MLLNRMLAPVGDALTPESAKAFANLRADDAAQRRIDYLADRCTEGQLTEEERDEYATLISAATVLAVLQSKARAFLASHAA